MCERGPSQQCIVDWPWRPGAARGWFGSAMRQAGVTSSRGGNRKLESPGQVLLAKAPSLQVAVAPDADRESNSL
jgi:hypothetical protein